MIHKKHRHSEDHSRDRAQGFRGERQAQRAMRGGGPDDFNRGGFGREGRGGRGGPRGGGRRRMFEGGELRLVLLRLMQTQPRHGYDLIREIETRTGGAYAPSPGIIYPSLTMLEDLGQITAANAEGSKRLFTLTPAGQTHIEEHAEEADVALARLDALGAEGAAVEAGPVWRALHNLKAVLEQRLSANVAGVAPDKDTLFKVVDLIDEAARKIERL